MLDLIIRPMEQHYKGIKIPEAEHYRIMRTHVTLKTGVLQQKKREREPKHSFKNI